MGGGDGSHPENGGTELRPKAVQFRVTPSPQSVFGTLPYQCMAPKAVLKFIQRDTTYSAQMYTEGHNADIPESLPPNIKQCTHVYRGT